MTIDPRENADASAIDDLYAQHYQTLLAAARRLTDRHTAEDAVQEAFLRVLVYRPQDRRAIDVGYLLVTVRNLIRRAHRRQALAAVFQQRSAQARDNSHLELPSELEALLRGLSSTRQEALVLTTVRGLGTNQAADALDLPAHTVAKQRRLAVRAMQRSAHLPAA